MLKGEKKIMGNIGPLISVIVPVYKVEDYIHRCIDSIINQTYKNLEIILVDDGSPDKCPQICDEYAQADSRIKVIHKNNGGLSAARNDAMKIAEGDIISFIDSDDWIELQTYEKLIDFMLLENLDCVFMGVSLFKNGEFNTVDSRFPHKTILDRDTVVNLMLKDEIGGQSCLKIYKRELWKDVFFPEGRLYEDLAISYKPFLKCEKVGFFNEHLYNYRMNDCGISLGFNPMKSYHIFLGFCEHLEYALQNSCRDVIDVCLKKAVNFALGTINVAINNNWASKENDVKDVSAFLKSHKNMIKKCKLFNLKYRTLLSLFYISPSLYYIVGKTAKAIMGKK